jgi:hypothetical protein
MYLYIHYTSVCIYIRTYIYACLYNVYMYIIYICMYIYSDRSGYGRLNRDRVCVCVRACVCISLSLSLPPSPSAGRVLIAVRYGWLNRDWFDVKRVMDAAQSVTGVRALSGRFSLTRSPQDNEDDWGPDWPPSGPLPSYLCICFLYIIYICMYIYVIYNLYIIL